MLHNQMVKVSLTIALTAFSSMSAQAGPAYMMSYQKSVPIVQTQVPAPDYMQYMSGGNYGLAYMDPANSNMEMGNISTGGNAAEAQGLLQALNNGEDIGSLFEQLTKFCGSPMLITEAWLNNCKNTLSAIAGPRSRKSGH